MTESNLRLPRPDKSGLAMTENIYPPHLYRKEKEAKKKPIEGK